MVTSKEMPAASPAASKPRRRGLGGFGFMFFLTIVLAGALALGGVAIFLPARLALVQERLIGLVHGGIAGSYEETYVDGCVQLDGVDGARAITRTRRVTSFSDGTSLEVVFSGQPALTNAC